MNQEMKDLVLKVKNASADYESARKQLREVDDEFREQLLDNIMNQDYVKENSLRLIGDKKRCSDRYDSPWVGIGDHEPLEVWIHSFSFGANVLRDCKISSVELAKKILDDYSFVSSIEITLPPNDYSGKITRREQSEKSEKVFKVINRLDLRAE